MKQSNIDSQKMDVEASEQPNKTKNISLSMKMLSTIAEDLFVMGVKSGDLQLYSEGKIPQYFSYLMN